MPCSPLGCQLRCCVVWRSPDRAVRRPRTTPSRRRASPRRRRLSPTRASPRLTEGRGGRDSAARRVVGWSNSRRSGRPAGWQWAVSMPEDVNPNSLDVDRRTLRIRTVRARCSSCRARDDDVESTCVVAEGTAILCERGRASELLDRRATAVLRARLKTSCGRAPPKAMAIWCRTVEAQHQRTRRRRPGGTIGSALHCSRLDVPGEQHLRGGAGCSAGGVRGPTAFIIAPPAARGVPSHGPLDHVRRWIRIRRCIQHHHRRSTSGDRTATNDLSETRALAAATREERHFSGS